MTDMTKEFEAVADRRVLDLSQVFGRPQWIGDGPDTRLKDMWEAHTRRCLQFAVVVEGLTWHSAPPPTAVSICGLAWGKPGDGDGRGPHASIGVSDGVILNADPFSVEFYVQQSGGPAWQEVVKHQQRLPDVVKTFVKMLRTAFNQPAPYTPPKADSTVRVDAVHGPVLGMAANQSPFVPPAGPSDDGE